MKNTVLALIALFIPLSSTFAQECTALEDPRDGNIYRTTWIGNQRWMVENLAFRTGTNSYPYNHDSTKAITYGLLYEMTGAETACPPGWHLPIMEEWMDMIDYLGGRTVAGTKMKDTFLWKTPSNGTNESGFSGLPGGMQVNNEGAEGIGEAAYFWSATEQNSSIYMAVVLTDSYKEVFAMPYYRSNALSVRCVKD